MFLKGLFLGGNAILVVSNIIIISIKNLRHLSFGQWFQVQLNVLFLVMCVVIFYTTIVKGIYDISYDEHPLDKKYWLRVWNYLNYKTRAEELKKNNQYLGYIYVTVKDRKSVTTEDVKRIKATLEEMKFEELMILSYMKTSQAYTSIFDLYLQRIKLLKYLLGGTFSVVVFNFINSNINLKEKIDSLLVGTTFEMRISFWVLNLILLSLFGFLFVGIEYVISNKQKREQIEPLLFNMIDKILEERRKTK